MVLLRTRFSVSDNSGAKTADCIRLVGPHTRPSIGSLFLISIHQLRHKQKVTKGTLHFAILVEKKQKECRMDGSSYRCSRNSVVLLTRSLQPIGTRILGLVPYEVRQAGFMKLLSLGTHTL